MPIEFINELIPIVAEIKHLNTIILNLGELTLNKLIFRSEQS